MQGRQHIGTPGVSRRSVLLGAVALAMGGAVVGLAACGFGGTAATGSKSDAPLAVKVLSFNNIIFQQPKDELLAALAEEQPNLKPDVIVFPGQIAMFREKALAMYAGGDVPDAQWMHPSITALMGSHKLLRPLEELAKRDKDKLSDFYPALLDQNRWKDATYALPWYNTGAGWFYNKALFERLGVQLPDAQDKAGKWNWDGFVSSMRALTRGTQGSTDRTIGSDTHNMELDWMCSWLWRAGGDVFSKDLKTCVLNQPAAVEAIQQLADLHLKYQVINYGPQKTDFTDGFKSGRVGIHYAPKGDTAPAVNDLSAMTFPMGMVGTFKGKAGRVNRMAALGFGAAQGAPNGDAGWRWTRWMAGPRAQGILMGRGTTLPVKPGHQQLPEFAKSMQPYESKEVWLESSATARALPQPANYTDIAALWTKTWNDILAEKGPIKGLLDDAVRQINALLAQE